MLKVIFALILVYVFFKVACSPSGNAERAEASRQRYIAAIKQCEEEIKKEQNDIEYGCEEYYQNWSISSKDREQNIQACKDGSARQIKEIQGELEVNRRVLKEREEHPHLTWFGARILDIAILTCIYAIGPALLLGLVIGLLRGK